MKSLPRKFYRKLIDSLRVLCCFCAGRKQTVTPLSPEPMENNSILWRQLECAVDARLYWLEERRKLGTLTALRTDWKVMAHSNEVIILSRKIADRIDELIPTHQLYVDLYNTAE